MDSTSESLFYYSEDLQTRILAGTRKDPPLSCCFSCGRYGWHPTMLKLVITEHCGDTVSTCTHETGLCDGCVEARRSNLEEDYEDRDWNFDEDDWGEEVEGRPSLARVGTDVVFLICAKADDYPLGGAAAEFAAAWKRVDQRARARRGQAR